MAEIPLLVRAHPFSSDSGLVYASSGQTIGQMLRAAAGEGRELAPLEVRIGGYVVPAELWDRLRPKEGARIEVTGLPQGNMNANWRAVLMIVVTIAVFAYTGYLDTNGASWALSTSQWATAAMMATSAAIPPSIRPPELPA